MHSLPGNQLTAKAAKFRLQQVLAESDIVTVDGQVCIETKLV